MMKIFCLLLWPLLLFACCDQPDEHAHPLLSKGTTVLVFVDKDSIIVAADSRSLRVWPDHHQEVEVSDTTNKVFRVGKVFFTASGTTIFKDKAVRSIILKNYNSKKSVYENCLHLNGLISKDLQGYFDQLSREERKYYTDDEIANTLITILATGYEKNKPIACKMNIGPRLIKNRIEVTSSPVKQDSMILHIQVGGYFESTYGYPYVYMEPAKDRLKDLLLLISWEARRHPVEVDNKVNYAIIKRNGFRVGRNY